MRGGWPTRTRGLQDTAAPIARAELGHGVLASDAGIVCDLVSPVFQLVKARVRLYLWEAPFFSWCVLLTPILSDRTSGRDSG